MLRRMAFRERAGAAALGLDARPAVLAHRQPDGGFRGRQGGSDLWYTDFALRALALGGGCDAGALAGVRSWLESRGPVADPVAGLNRAIIRRRLGLPVEAPSALPESSAYAIFCWSVTCALAGVRVRREQAEPLLGLLRGGGFAEHAAAATPQANATAAALVALALAGALEPGVRGGAAAWLAGLQAGDGGVRAHADAPGGDLLSSATALWALTALGEAGRLRAADLGRFAAGLRRPDGGFAAVPGDDAGDPEYTYYGLSVLALLRWRARLGWRGWLRLLGGG